MIMLDSPLRLVRVLDGYGFLPVSSTPQIQSALCAASLKRVSRRFPALRRPRTTSALPEGTKERNKESKMTIALPVRISDKKLLVKDRILLSGVSENVNSASDSDSGRVNGVFLGATFPESSDRHVLALGTLRDVRFMASFRFKLWWSAQMIGNRGRDVPTETQFLLVELQDSGEIFYAVFLPLLDGLFRASLQGNPGDQLEICIESGDPLTRASSFSHSLFVSAGPDPFAAVSDAIATVKLHLKTFRQLSEKRLPGIVDYFGWCTWDAFYTDVSADGVEAGLASLTTGGIPPKFIIIDDGWQSVAPDPEPAAIEQGKQVHRLTGIKENHKFQRKTADGQSVEGIEHVVDIAKTKYDVKFVYVWHAITGYWGGVRPEAPGMEHYGSTLKYAEPSPGILTNDPSMKTDMMTVQGLGVVHPGNVYQFYNELHEYLAGAGVDGVKVDVQSVLETLGGGLGGRVALTSKYHHALDASIARNFPDNGIIACMSHGNDVLYCSKQTAVVRVSDDFYPRDPVSHTIHIASVAYNSIFLGEFMQSDWDMFHSLHPAGEYHAAARAISGGPIYVSDAPGKHNFELLRKLVLPDGSVLRARLPGRPTADCLFADPTRDGVSLMKIWNMNDFTGVLGVFNCQGAAWCRTEKKNVFHRNDAETLTGSVRARDVHLISQAAVDPEWNGDAAVYSHKGELIRLPHDATLPVTLRILEHETFTITPIKVLAPGFEFAPLGLIDMINAGGAIESYEVHIIKEGVADAMNPLPSTSGRENGSRPAIATARMEVKGCGRFGAYSSTKPRRCLVNDADIDFIYDSPSGLLSLLLQMPRSPPLQTVVVEM